MKQDFTPVVNYNEIETIKFYNFYGKLYGVNQFGEIYRTNNIVKSEKIPVCYEGQTEDIVLLYKMKQKLNEDGYPVVFIAGAKSEDNTIKRYYEKVHKMVATCFVSKPNSEDKLEVNHLDCNRTNNYYTNLEWITHYENVQYSIKMGNHKNIKCIGTDNIKCKLTENDVKFIRQKYKEGLKIRQIYRQFYINKVTETSIENICKYRTWKHID